MTQWIELDCDRCGEANLIDNGDVSDQTVMDVETFKCHACGAVNQMPEYDGEEACVIPGEKYADVHGVPVPKR